MKYAGKKCSIGLVGQPNCGKTSLFNRLTGTVQHVGNWPGVTVEKLEGFFSYKNCDFSIIDLPGVYSLSPYTMEEIVTRQFLLTASPDIIINIVDATHLERHLYLTLQLLLMNIPMILVLNMMDEVEQKSIVISTARLSELLGIPIVKMIARDGKGVNDLIEAIVSCIDKPIAFDINAVIDDDEIFTTIKDIKATLQKSPQFDGGLWYALKVLEKDVIIIEELQKKIPLEVNSSLIRCAEFYNSNPRPIQEALSDWFYGLARGVTTEVITMKKPKDELKKAVTIFLDSIALHSVYGILLFFLLLFLMFQGTFSLGNVFAEYINNIFLYLSGLGSLIPTEIIKSFINNGIISGVGNVMLLIPNIFLLFFFLGILEDTGYMARAAFVMDRFMHRIGLHGKSFIPLIMGFGCNVPAIMATRSLSSEQERIKTILMIPFLSCSGRFPIYVFFVSAFFTKFGGLIIFSLYFIGILMAVITGLLLKKMALKQHSDGLIMELPPFRFPHFRNIVTSSLIKVKSYFYHAGSIIFIFSLLLWALSYFPHPLDFGGSTSFIGYIGHYIAYVMQPLGFDWKMTVSLISGFFAKELVISNLAIVYSEGTSLFVQLKEAINPVIAYAYLLFIVLYIPCVGTISVIRKETNSVKWTVFSMLYGIAAAWIVAFVFKTVFSLFKILLVIK